MEDGAKRRDLEDDISLQKRCGIRQTTAKNVCNTEDVRQLVRASGSVRGELDRRLMKHLVRKIF